jgi:cytidylate kinase
MTTRVISISRQVGTAGEEVAQAVANRLGFRYVDYQVIQEAAAEAGVSPETVSEAEHSPSLLTRILEALARNPAMPAAGWADPVPLSTSPLYTSADYRRFLEDVIRDLADRGNCVIVGHAAQVILRDRPDTVRVLVTGSPKYRARRIMAGMGVDEKEALKIIERTDTERLDYFRRFYDTGWLTPSTYDLCISTDRISPGQAADVIVQFASLPRLSPS